MNDIRKFLKDNLSLVDIGDYEMLYAKCQSRYRPELTKLLLQANINPIYHMSEIPAIYAEEVAITNLIVPSNVKSISYASFRHSGVETVEFLSGLEAIGEEAFYMCHNLIGVTIPSGVRQISKAAFAQCTKLRTAYIGEGIRYLEDDVFMGCLELKDLYLPSTLIMIKDFGKYCSKLEQIYFNGTGAQWDAIEKHPNWTKYNEIERIICINEIINL